MKKNKKKLSKQEKSNLKFMIEDFMEKDKKALLKFFKNRPDKGKEFFTKLDLILLEGIPFPGRHDTEDMEDVYFKKLIINLHQVLKPIWNSIKSALVNFQDEINPARKTSLKLKSDIISGKINKNEAIYEFQELFLLNSHIDEEKYYQIEFQYPLNQHYISFETGSIDFQSVPTQPLINFRNLFKGVPISLFSRCAYEKCNKMIVLTRANKSYCTGTNCAAKKHQSDKWEKDPEGMRRAERKRNRTKHKK